MTSLIHSLKPTSFIHPTPPECLFFHVIFIDRLLRTRLKKCGRKKTHRLPPVPPGGGPNALPRWETDEEERLSFSALPDCGTAASVWDFRGVRMVSVSFVGVVILLALVSPRQALYFHIGETEKKCFIEEIPDETMVIGELTC